MTDVFLERAWREPRTENHLEAMVADALDCMALYRVDWQESLLSTDGRTLVCRFSGPDADSVRLALRTSVADERIMWPGTLHAAPGLAGDELLTANVIVRRVFDAAVSLGDVQAIEDAGIGCLQAHGVTFIRTFFAADRRRMICLYRAPDAESVRVAQRQANLPVDRVWAFRRFAPDTI